MKEIPEIIGDNSAAAGNTHSHPSSANTCRIAVGCCWNNLKMPNRLARLLAAIVALLIPFVFLTREFNYSGNGFVVSTSGSSSSDAQQSEDGSSNNADSRRASRNTQTTRKRASLEDTLFMNSLARQQQYSRLKQQQHPHHNRAGYRGSGESERAGGGGSMDLVVSATNGSSSVMQDFPDDLPYGFTFASALTTVDKDLCLVTDRLIAARNIRMKIGGKGDNDPISTNPLLVPVSLTPRVHTVPIHNARRRANMAVWYGATQRLVANEPPLPEDESSHQRAKHEEEAMETFPLTNFIDHRSLPTQQQSHHNDISSCWLRELDLTSPIVDDVVCPSYEEITKGAALVSPIGSSSLNVRSAKMNSSQANDDLGGGEGGSTGGGEQAGTGRKMLSAITAAAQSLHQGRKYPPQPRRFGRYEGTSLGLFRLFGKPPRNAFADTAGSSNPTTAAPFGVPPPPMPILDQYPYLQLLACPPLPTTIAAAGGAFGPTVNSYTLRQQGNSLVVTPTAASMDTQSPTLAPPQSSPYFICRAPKTRDDDADNSSSTTTAAGASTTSNDDEGNNTPPSTGRKPQQLAKDGNGGDDDVANSEGKAAGGNTAVAGNNSGGDPLVGRIVLGTSALEGTPHPSLVGSSAGTAPHTIDRHYSLIKARVTSEVRRFRQYYYDAFGAAEEWASMEYHHQQKGRPPRHHSAGGRRTTTGTLLTPATVPDVPPLSSNCGSWQEEDTDVEATILSIRHRNTIGTPLSESKGSSLFDSVKSFVGGGGGSQHDSSLAGPSAEAIRASIQKHAALHWSRSGCEATLRNGWESTVMEQLNATMAATRSVPKFSGGSFGGSYKGSLLNTPYLIPQQVVADDADDPSINTAVSAYDRAHNALLEALLSSSHRQNGEYTEYLQLWKPSSTVPLASTSSTTTELPSALPTGLSRKKGLATVVSEALRGFLYRKFRDEWAGATVLAAEASSGSTTSSTSSAHPEGGASHEWEDNAKRFAASLSSKVEKAASPTTLSLLKPLLKAVNHVSGNNKKRREHIEFLFIGDSLTRYAYCHFFNTLKAAIPNSKTDASCDGAALKGASMNVLSLIGTLDEDDTLWEQLKTRQNAGGSVGGIDPSALFRKRGRLGDDDVEDSSLSPFASPKAKIEIAVTVTLFTSTFFGEEVASHIYSLPGHGYEQLLRRYYPIPEVVVDGGFNGTVLSGGGAVDVLQSPSNLSVPRPRGGLRESPVNADATTNKGSAAEPHGDSVGIKPTDVIRAAPLPSMVFIGKGMWDSLRSTIGQPDDRLLMTVEQLSLGLQRPTAVDGNGGGGSRRVVGRALKNAANTQTYTRRKRKSLALQENSLLYERTISEALVALKALFPTAAMVLQGLQQLVPCRPNIGLTHCTGGGVKKYWRRRIYNAGRLYNGYRRWVEVGPLPTTSADIGRESNMPTSKATSTIQTSHHHYPDYLSYIDYDTLTPTMNISEFTRGDGLHLEHSHLADMTALNLLDVGVRLGLVYDTQQQQSRQRAVDATTAVGGGSSSRLAQQPLRWSHLPQPLTPQQLWATLYQGTDPLHEARLFVDGDLPTPRALRRNIKVFVEKTSGGGGGSKDVGGGNDLTASAASSKSKQSLISTLARSLIPSTPIPRNPTYRFPRGTKCLVMVLEFTRDSPTLYKHGAVPGQLSILLGGAIPSNSRAGVAEGVRQLTLKQQQGADVNASLTNPQAALEQIQFALATRRRLEITFAPPLSFLVDNPEAVKAMDEHTDKVGLRSLLDVLSVFHYSSSSVGEDGLVGGSGERLTPPPNVMVSSGGVMGDTPQLPPSSPSPSSYLDRSPAAIHQRLLAERMLLSESIHTHMILKALEAYLEGMRQQQQHHGGTTTTTSTTPTGCASVPLVALLPPSADQRSAPLIRLALDFTFGRSATFSPATAAATTIPIGYVEMCYGIYDSEKEMLWLKETLEDPHYAPELPTVNVVIEEGGDEFGTLLSKLAGVASRGAESPATSESTQQHHEQDHDTDEERRKHAQTAVYEAASHFAAQLERLMLTAISDLTLPQLVLPGDAYRLGVDVIRIRKSSKKGKGGKTKGSRTGRRRVNGRRKRKR